MNTVTATEYFKQLAEELGLDGFKPELTQVAHEYHAYYVYFSSYFKVDYSSDVQQSVLKKITEIFDAVKNSPYVTGELANMKHEIASLNEQIFKQGQEIIRLKEFETYYNLAIKLAHGEKSEN